MDSYTNEASQVQNDRCNLFPDAHVLRKFRKLKQKLKRPHFRQGTQYQQVFLFEKKNGTGKTRKKGKKMADRVDVDFAPP